MDKRRLEAKVVELVDRVVNGTDIEDSLVECKTQWPLDHAKAARQIAGLANAARGQEALWLIGLDEDGHRVVQPKAEELANWWPRVRKRFDGVAPEMRNILVPTDHGTVIVLEFTTDRSPYVVNTDGQRGGDREVPWRVGNSTQSATRGQLLSVLVASNGVPELELIDPSLEASNDEIFFTATLFISATDRALLPKHLWKMTASTSEWPEAETADLQIELSRHRSGSRGWVSMHEMVRDPALAESPDEPEHPYGVLIRTVGLIINGSDSLRLSASAKLDANQARTITNAAYFTVKIEMPVDRSDRVVRVEAKLRCAPTTIERNGVLARWVLETQNR